jgi:hypothetical protein
MVLNCVGLPYDQGMDLEGGDLPCGHGSPSCRQCPPVALVYHDAWEAARGVDLHHTSAHGDGHDAREVRATTTHGKRQPSVNRRWHMAMAQRWRPSTIAHPCHQWWCSLIFSDLLVMVTSYTLMAVRLVMTVTLWFGGSQIQVGDGCLPVMVTALCGDRGLLTFRQWQDSNGR